MSHDQRTKVSLRLAIETGRLHRASGLFLILAESLFLVICMVRTRSQRKRDADAENAIRINGLPALPRPLVDVDEFYVLLSPEHVRLHGHAPFSFPPVVEEALARLPAASSSCHLARVEVHLRGSVLVYEVRQCAPEA